MDGTTTMLLLLGLTLGILYKTYAPYARKKKEGKVQSFDVTYLITAVVAFVSAMVTALGMLPQAMSEWTDEWPFGTGYFAVVLFGFLWAIGWNYGTNRILGPPKDKSKKEVI